MKNETKTSEIQKAWMLVGAINQKIRDVKTRDQFDQMALYLGYPFDPGQWHREGRGNKALKTLRRARKAAIRRAIALERTPEEELRTPASDQRQIDLFHFLKKMVYLKEGDGKWL